MFDKGLNMDYNVLYQPDGTYRYMKNCSLISQDGNNYVIKDCLGNVQVFTINYPYLAAYTVIGSIPSPIGFISFPDKLIVFSTNNETETGGYGEIGIIKYLPYGEGVQPLAVAGQLFSGYTPLYHHVSLNFTKLRQIEGFGFEENESIQRIYWTDNLSQPRTLNIADSSLTDYITSGGANPPVTGTQYMVLQGAITYDAVNYGPGLTAGNIFTATATATFTDLTGPFPTPLIVPYTIPYELLDFNPSTKLGTIKFDSYGSGSVYCGGKIYFYRLKDSNSGTVTNWSYGSYPIQVGTLNSVTAVSAGTYFDFTGGGTSSTPLNSGFSVNINITEIDTNFTTIEVACAEYDQTFGVPRLISIIESTDITGSEMTIEHTGTINLGELTINDLTLFPISIVTCKTMTSNKNYLLIGNIKERGEVDFTNTATATETTYYMPTHYNSGCANVFTYDDVGPDPNNNPVLADIFIGTKWIVSGSAYPDATDTVEYPNGTTWYDGQVFTGNNSATITFNGTGTARPCVSINKYTAINSTTNTDERPNYIQIKESSGPQKAYWNMKHPAVASMVKGHWHDKYRYGILFFDKKRNPFYVRHLLDFQYDSINDSGIIYDDTAGGVYSLLSHGIRFSGIKLSRELTEKISGFSIVRAERDKRVITQGFLTQVGSDISVPGSYKYYPEPCPIVNEMQYNTPTANRYSLVCPDVNSAFPTIVVDSATFSNIEEVCFLDTDGNFHGKTEDNQCETKYLTAMTGVTNRDTNVIEAKKVNFVNSVDENGSINAFGESGSTFYNQSFLGTIAGAVDTTCSANAYTDISGAVGSGNKKLIIQLDSAEKLYDYKTQYTTFVEYYDLPNVDKMKLLVDVVIDKPVQYGGDSDLAKANTIYIQCGHYQPITDEVIADNNNTNNVSTYTELEFNEVDVYGGDAYTNLIDNGFSLYNDTITPVIVPPNTDNYSWGVKFPCQSNSNYDLRRGRTVSNSLMHTSADGVVYASSAAIRLESFSYNSGYSTEETFFAYPAFPINYNFNDVFRNRIRYAGPKINGEAINSFRTFLSADYKDMDGIGGEINNLRTKDGRTIVWQNAVISSVPLLERQLISGSDGAETTIGTGGVVDRFDVINSYYGNQHQWGLTQTEYGYAWFDMRRKAVVVLDMSNGLSEVSFVDGIKSFFDEIFVENTSNTVTNNFIDSPSFNKESDRPIMGVGITGVYDPKFKMTYLTFKFQYRGDKTNKDFTIGYYHPKRQFIGFYDWTPGIAWNHNELVLSSNNPKNPTKYYGAGMASTLFAIGDIIGVGATTYVCYAAGTVAVYAATPSAAIFERISDTSELWVHNQQPPTDNNYVNPPLGYTYNSFFGYVVDNEVEFVINPKTENPFTVNNIEQEGNTVNFTDIYTDAEGITASDLSITSTDRNYRTIYDKITSSLPLSTTGRITNSYLKVRWVKKNWTSDRTVFTNSVKILRYIRSFFVQKR